VVVTNKNNNMSDLSTADALAQISVGSLGESVFESVEQAAPIAVFQLKYDCIADTNPKKINLGVGAYRTDQGKPWPLPVVREAERQIATDKSLDKEYLPTCGLPAFVKASTELLLGADHPAFAEDRVDGAQSISGTGALMLSAHFLVNFYGDRAETPVYVSKQTWGNHRAIFKRAGFKNIRDYAYWDADKLGLDINGMLDNLQNAPVGSIVILHGCAHNPTGCDATREQWVEIFKILISRKLFPIFDNAYQGFATGDPDFDAWAIRLYAQTGNEMFVTQSYAKNFGLYNERTGCLAMICQNREVINRMKSQITLVIRQLYSSPPVHGALIVSRVLNTPELKAEWLENIKTMSGRIMEMRTLLKGKLDEYEPSGSNRTWDHIVSQIGMFSFTGLNKNQCAWMKNERSIYLMDNGRISMAGVTGTNADYLAKCMVESFEHA